MRNIFSYSNYITYVKKNSYHKSTLIFNLYSDRELIAKANQGFYSWYFNCFNHFYAYKWISLFRKQKVLLVRNVVLSWYFYSNRFPFRTVIYFFNNSVSIRISESTLSKLHSWLFCWNLKNCNLYLCLY